MRVYHKAVWIKGEVSPGVWSEQILCSEKKEYLSGLALYIAFEAPSLLKGNNMDALHT